MKLLIADLTKRDTSPPAFLLKSLQLFELSFLNTIPWHGSHMMNTQFACIWVNMHSDMEEMDNGLPSVLGGRGKVKLEREA